MRYMINRLAPVVVILLSAFVLAGCSAVFGENPREQADQAISSANKSISQHNELFDDARSTYADVKQKIESGDDPSKEKDNIAEAKNTLEKARKYLQDARESLETVANLDVDKQTYAVVSPKVILRSDYNSQDQVTLQYSRWFYGSGVNVRTGYPPREDASIVPDENTFSLTASMWW